MQARGGDGVRVSLRDVPEEIECMSPCSTGVTGTMHDAVLPTWVCAFVFVVSHRRPPASEHFDGPREQPRLGKHIYTSVPYAKVC